MTQHAYCPMIHGGLSINLIGPEVLINHCCLRKDPIITNSKHNLWEDQGLLPLRNLNKLGKWDNSCSACSVPEAAGIISFRTGMLETFGVQQDLPGPLRLDLNFDASCNLACRSCVPECSTMWVKHLKDNNLPVNVISNPSRADDMINILQGLNLDNLQMVVMAGGESLLGNSYWKVAEAITKLVPDAQNQLTICFQTNGTQPIPEKYYEIINKCKLVKLHFSIDGIGEKFEYLRWPANWNQVTENLINLRDVLPPNVMFSIEETISIFNLYYTSELEEWAKLNYSKSRMEPSESMPDGDPINHNKHLAIGIFGLCNLTKKYVDAISNTPLVNLVEKDWTENPAKIMKMVEEIEKFDRIRNQDWKKTFPEVADFYSDYLR